MGSSNKKKTGPSWLNKVAEHPLIVLACLAATVVGIIVMFVLFFMAQTERDLVYAVNPVRTEVVSTEKGTGLEILHEGVELGGVDITVVQIAIWNAGDGSIRKENVLRDVIIVTDPPVRILEASVVKYYRAVDITGISVLKSQELLNTGKVGVSWRILEKNDGVSIQVMYIGAPDVHFGVEGLIEGCGEIKSVGTGIEIESPEEQVEKKKRGRWVYIGLGFFYSATLLVGSYIFFKGADSRGDKIFATLVGLAGLGGLGVSIWAIMSKVADVPPFGF